MNSLLEKHLRSIRPRQQKDFRSANLHRLIERFVDGQTILDVGCGTGGAVVYFARKGYSIKGLEPSEKMVEEAKSVLRSRHLPEDLVVQGDALSVSEKFSTILSLDVLEHVRDDGELLRRMSDRLLPHGRLIVVVPALPWLFGPKDASVGHYRRYSKPSILSVVERCGLDILHVQYWNFIGVVPTALSAKLLKRPVNESFRYGGEKEFRPLNTWLFYWFRHIENVVRFPVGLSLLVVTTRKPRTT